MTDVFTSHLDFISTRESQESNEILLKRCFITKSLMHARTHPHTGEFSGFFKRKFHSFRHLLGGEAQDGEDGVVLVWSLYSIRIFLQIKTSFPNLLTFPYQLTTTYFHFLNLCWQVLEILGKNFPRQCDTLYVSNFWEIRTVLCAMFFPKLVWYIDCFISNAMPRWLYTIVTLIQKSDSGKAKSNTVSFASPVR